MASDKKDPKSPGKGAKLSGIKSGAFSRGFALARVSLSAGAKVASHAVGNIFGDEDTKGERLKAMVISQMDLLSRELGELKGSLMKVGQMLSMMGEHLLPPEANALLKSLQNQSPPLEWKVIEKVLKRQLGEEKLALVEINPEPLASASMGQVHLAKRKSDGRLLAMKIQYPGVDQAIESDLKALKSIFTLAKFLPTGPKFDELFAEVRQMLHQEVDYKRELETTNEFRALLADDPRYVVPETVSELSTGRVLTTTFEEGIAADSPEVKALSQDRRNALGFAFLELYLKEFFRWGKVQTDPHFGNYRVRLGKNGECDQIVLLDFGAVRKFPKNFLASYYEMSNGAYFQDQSRVEKGALGLGFLIEGDPDELKLRFAEVAYLFVEGFQSSKTCMPEAKHLFNSDEAYDWGTSDLPKRVIKKGKDVVMAFKLRVPPREVVFLDRKMGGIFIFLSTLKVQIRASELLEKYLVDSKHHLGSS